MKGIILSAGKGTRLYPSTMAVPKALVPVYDKPLIYYPLSILMEMEIKDVLVIVAPDTVGQYEALLGDGSHIGMNIQYEVQTVARGIADGLIIAKEFVGDDSCCLVLGDNILYDPNIEEVYEQVKDLESGAAVFGLWVEDPRPFGVVEFDDDGNVLSIEEKPQKPKSNYIIPGIYVYDSKAAQIAEGLSSSARGELEITDVNKEYLKLGELKVMPLPQEAVWFDAGTADNLLLASQTMKEMHDRDMNAGYVEELALRKGYITEDEYLELCNRFKNNEYGRYLKNSYENTFKSK